MTLKSLIESTLPKR